MRRGKRFFTHTITVLTEQSVSNGMGGTKKQWLPVNNFKGFMDTPTTQSQLLAMQMQKTLDRNLYYPSNISIPAKCRLQFGNVLYEPSGESLDQGGQGKIFLLPLKKVI